MVSSKLPSDSGAGGRAGTESNSTVPPLLDNGREYYFTRRDFERVKKLIHGRAGISLNDSKQDMVYSRLARRLRVLKIWRFCDYLDHLESPAGSDEWQSFINALTTNLTSFFREPHHFTILREHLARLGSRHSDNPVRIWCAAASTGEEPYSLAITVAEHFGTFNAPASIIASDIDTQVLEFARRGVYPMERVEQLSQERLQKFFLRGTGSNEGYCRVVDGLRRLITFEPINLLETRWPLQGRYDAIFCRNVMIYFDKPTQLSIIRKMVPLLADNGLFFAGHSESFFHASDLIRPVGRTVYHAVRPAKDVRP